MYLNESQIKQIKNFFQDKPVEKVFLFGSYAVGDATEESDIDLLIESNSEFRFLKFSGQIEELEKTLNKKIDFVGMGALRPDRYFTKFVNEQKKIIYEKD